MGLASLTCQMIPKIRGFINPPYSTKDILIILGLLILFVSIPLTVILIKEFQETRPKTKSPPVSEEKILEEQTINLLSLNSALKKAAKAEKSQILNQMTDVAKARKKRLSLLIEKEPESVLRQSLPTEVKSALPPSVQKEIEDWVRLEGSLEVLQADYFEEQRGEVQFFLQAKKGKYTLYSAEEFPALLTGASIKVSGVALGKKVVLDEEIKQDEKVLAATTGQTTYAVLLVNFQNDTRQGFTKAIAEGIMFTNASSVNNFFQQSSYGKASLGGDVYGWYTLPIDQTCNIGPVETEARKAAAADVNFDDYDGLVIAFPGSCGWIGKTFIGGSEVFVTTSYFNLHVLGHEIGHNYGAWHANAYECGLDAIGTNCSSIEYADRYDIMGNRNAGHFNAYHKEKFAWFDPAQIITVGASGTFSIEPLETATAGPKIIKVPREPLIWHYIEYRQPTGFDSALPGNVFDGALIHYSKFDTGGDTQLIDTTPLTSSTIDSALEVGQTFSDPDAGITIRTISKSPSQLEVEVDIGPMPCVRGRPTVDTDPSQVTGAAGETKTLTVTVTNNDMPACGPSIFSLETVLPSGWSTVLADTELTINPLETVSTTLNITSSAGATEGTHFVQVRATNNSDSSFTHTYWLRYFVFNGGDTEDPTVSITSPIEGETVSGAVTVTANASDNIGVERVEFYADGSLKSTDTTSPYTYDWDTTQETDGSHTLIAKAYDAVGNMGESSSVTVTVANPVCSQADPNVGLTPATQSGVAGGSLDYTFSVTNNDSADCSGSTFSLSKTIPTGWSVAFSPISLTLSPGASGSVTFRVTSSALASPNNYTVTAKATNSTDSGYNASASATYEVTTPPTRPGDLNGDNQVDYADLSILLGNWKTTDATADINNDSIVNILDLTIILSDWGS